MTRLARIGTATLGALGLATLMYLTSPFLGRGFSYSIIGQAPMVSYQGQRVLNLNFALAVIAALIFTSSLIFKFRKNGPSLKGFSGGLGLILNCSAVFFFFGLMFSFVLWLSVIGAAIGHNFLAHAPESRYDEVEEVNVYEYSLWVVLLISSAVLGSVFSLLTIGGS